MTTDRLPDDFLSMDSFESISRSSFLLLPKDYVEGNLRLDNEAKRRKKLARKNRKKTSAGGRKRSTRYGQLNQELEEDESSDEDDEDLGKTQKKRRKGDTKLPFVFMHSSKPLIYEYAEEVSSEDVLKGKPKKYSDYDKWTVYNEHNKFTPLFDNEENYKLVILRQVIMQKKWNSIVKWYEDTAMKLNTVAFSSIHKYIDDANKEKTKLNTNSSINDFGKLIDLEIPTGVIFSGVNLSDSEGLFMKFVEKLYDEQVHAPVIIPSYSNMTLKQCAKLIVDSVLNISYVDLKVNENFELESKSLIAPYDLSILETWYSSSNLQGNIILFFPEFESFDSELISNLLTILADYASRIPIILIFGVATSMDSIYQTFTRIQLKYLCIEKFWLQHSNSLINAFIDELIINPNGPLNIGLNPYELLLNRYQLYNYSISSFITSLHYTCLDKYYSSPVSFIYDEYVLNENNKILKELTPSHLREFRMFSSFRKYLDNIVQTDPDDCIKLLYDDKRLLNFVSENLLEIYEYQHKVDTLIKCLLAIQLMLNSPNIARPSRTLYIPILSGSLLPSEYMTLIFQLLKKKSASIILELLEELISIFSNAIAESKTKFEYVKNEKLTYSETVSTTLDFYNDIILEVQNQITELKDISEKEVLEKEKVKEEIDSLRRRRNKSKEEQPEKSLSSELIINIVNYIKTLFEENLYSYKDHILHECVFYSNSIRIQKSFHPRPRASIQTALENTQHYIKAAPSNNVNPDNRESATISRTLPDIAICYRLYLEGSKVINVYDWFVAFCSIVSHGKIDVATEVVKYRMKEQEQMKVNEETTVNDQELHDNQFPTVSRQLRLLQARFIRAVAELQFIGFIKPQNKMDFVARLTWGRM